MLLMAAGCKDASLPKPTSKERRAKSKEVGLQASRSVWLASGEVPFDVSQAGFTALRGDFVLAPPRKWIDQGLKVRARTSQKDEQGRPRHQAYFFYGGWLVEPGPVASKIKTRTDQESIIPNTLIIPIRRGETAQPGDVVLTVWASGSGMQRAMVVKGGTPRRPAVRYLDMKYDDPAGMARRQDVLLLDTFHKLEPGILPGATVAIREGGKYWRGVVVRAQKEAVLAVGFGGRIKVAARASCAALPLNPRVKQGDRVHVPFLGYFRPALVKEYSPNQGRVLVILEHADKTRELSVGYTNVLPSLPAPPTSQPAPDAG